MTGPENPSQGEKAFHRKNSRTARRKRRMPFSCLVSKRLSKSIPLAKDPSGGQKQKAGQPVSEQDACPQAAPVPALIGRAELNHAVQHQGKQQRRGPEGTGVAQPPCCQGGQGPCQFSRTAGADRKLLPFVEKGAVRPAVASAENGKPLVQPRLKASPRQGR